MNGLGGSLGFLWFLEKHRVLSNDSWTRSKQHLAGKLHCVLEPLDKKPSIGTPIRARDEWTSRCHHWGKRIASREMGVSLISMKSPSFCSDNCVAFPNTVRKPPFKSASKSRMSNGRGGCRGTETAESHMTNHMSGGKSVLPNRLLQSARLQAATVCLAHASECQTVSLGRLFHPCF